jgi:hypothetical protein
MPGKERLEKTCLRRWEDNYVKIISINARNRGRRGGVKITRAVRKPPSPRPTTSSYSPSGFTCLVTQNDRQSYVTNHFPEQSAGRPCCSQNTIQYTIFVGKSKWKRPLETPKSRIKYLKYILKKTMWAGFIRLRRGTSGGFLQIASASVKGPFQSENQKLHLIPKR